MPNLPNKSLSVEDQLRRAQQTIDNLRSRLSITEQQGVMIYENGMAYGREQAHGEIARSLEKAIRLASHDGQHTTKVRLLNALLHQIRTKMVNEARENRHDEVG